MSEREPNLHKSMDYVCVICKKEIYDTCECGTPYCGVEHQRLHWTRGGHRYSQHHIAGSTAVRWDEKLVVDFYRTGTEIGRGGFGTVYANEAYPGVAIKYSQSTVSCAAFGSEFEIAQRIQSAVEQHGFTDPNVEVVKVLAEVRDIRSLHADKTWCALVMHRVLRPRIEFGASNNMSYQAYIGEEGEARSYPGRGNYIGPELIAEVVAPVKLKRIATSLGRLMGFLHYYAKVGATDMEYILGTDATDDTARIFALDFDRVKPIENYRGNTVEDLQWSMSAEPYFPMPEHAIFSSFERAYIDMAASAGAKDVAEKVMEAYRMETKL